MEISDLQSTTTIDNGDYFVISVPDLTAPTGFTTKRISKASLFASLQSGGVVSCKTANKTDTQVISSSNNDWHDVTGLSITHAAISGANVIRISGVLSGAGTDSINSIALRVLQDSTPIGIGDAGGSGQIQITSMGYPQINSVASIPFDFSFVATNTNNHVYKVQVSATMAPGTGGLYINRAQYDSHVYNPRAVSSLILTELVP